jgi:hypothetical protein
VLSHSRSNSKTKKAGIGGGSIVDKLRNFKEDLNEMFPCKSKRKSPIRENQEIDVKFDITSDKVKRSQTSRSVEKVGQVYQ